MARRKVTFEQVRLLIALIAAIAIFAVVGYMSTLDTTAKPMPINGDTVGRDNSETIADYQARVKKDLDMAPNDKKAYALVTFDKRMTTTAAGALLEKAKLSRVDALILDGVFPIPLPEPTSGHSRADVFDHILGVLAPSNGQTGRDLEGRVRGVVVYDTGEHLKALAKMPGVLAVDVLPPDAAWGRFGIQPVVTGKDTQLD